jgi:hypothetical protein
LQHILTTNGIVPDGDGGQGWGFGSFAHFVTAPPSQNSHADTAPVAATEGNRDAATPATAAGRGRRRKPGFLSGTMATLLACGGLAVALIAGGAGGSPSHEWTDTRQEVYELTGQHLQDSDSVVALFPSSSVRDRGDGTSALKTVTSASTITSVRLSGFGSSPASVPAQGSWWRLM